MALSPNNLNLAWHSLSVKESLRRLEVTNERGLSEKEAKARLENFGPNKIKQKKRESRLQTIGRQLKNPLIYILIASTFLTAFMGKTADGVVILCVVLANTIIGYIQERQAGDAIHALTLMMSEEATVIRDKDEVSVPAEELVPGDIVIINAGEKVTADLRLIEQKSLNVDESALTGESEPSSKKAHAIEAATPLAERSSMLFQGSLTTSGQGKGVVVATGSRTEFGKISDLLQETKKLETPLTKTFKSITNWISLITLVVSLLIFFIALYRGFPWIEAALSAVTLAVASIPEGLPAVITIASAIGVRRMAKKNAIIRHLNAVETLGSADVICADKTGTLTRNQITVKSIWCPSQSCEVKGDGLEPSGEIICDQEAIPNEKVRELLLIGTLCNDSSLDKNQEGVWEGIGDPTEVALIVAARKMDMHEDKKRQDFPRLDMTPFDSDKMFMASLHQIEGGKVELIKGAPETVLQNCVNKKDVEKAKRVNDKMTNEGMRVIAFAKAPKDKLNHDELEKDLELIGLVAMKDPLRDEVKEAVQNCHKAGIQVKMITGDHPSTAASIARQLDIIHESEAVMTGQDLQEASNESIENASVFARVEPKDKLKIIKALQENKHTVAMTGDGVNDAAALKRADIGVAMGQMGSAVAKEASDMILTDDNFKTIESAVEEGRRVFDNILKSVVFVLPTSFAQALIVVASVMFFPSDLRPMSPVQVLYVNLVVAIALALPLGFEAKEPDLMERKPRDVNKSIFDSFIVFRMIFVSMLIAGTAIALFWFEFQSDIKLGVEKSQALKQAQTMAVTAIVLSQVFYLLNCRSLTYGLRKIGFFTNKFVFLGIALILGAQFIYIYLPFMNRWFHSRPLSAESLFIALGVAFFIFPIIGLEKMFWKKRKVN